MIVEVTSVAVLLVGVTVLRVIVLRVTVVEDVGSSEVLVVGRVLE